MAQLITVCLLVLIQAAPPVLGLNNVFCGSPQEVVIATNAPHHGFYPYFVKLHRCVGSSGLISPSLQRCVAKSYKEIPLKVRSITSSEMKIVTLTNHTTCGPECVTRPSDCDPEVQRWEENQCSCKCMYQDGPPKSKKHKEGFRWNVHLCRFVCSRPPAICPREKVWTKEACGCECSSSAKRSCDLENKVINTETCECIGGKHLHGNQPGFFSYPHSHEMLAGLIFEGALILILIGVLVYFCRRSRQETALPSKSKGLQNDVDSVSADCSRDANLNTVV